MRLWLSTMAVLAAVLMTAPAKADAPSCDAFRSRLTKANQVLEVDAPGIQTFRQPDNMWKLTLHWIDEKTDGGTLRCDEDGEVESLNLLLPWSTNIENGTFPAERRDAVVGLIAEVIYAYAPWKKPAQIMEMADDVFDKRQRPTGLYRKLGEATPVTIEGDAKIELQPMFVYMIARGEM
jgi:hypothetical protein